MKFFGFYPTIKFDERDRERGERERERERERDAKRSAVITTVGKVFHTN